MPSPVAKQWKQMNAREKEAAVLPLALRGMTASAIAGELGLDSRNSIITVIGRLQKAGSWRGAQNPHSQDFKARAEQRAASPGIVISRAAAFDPLPGVDPVLLTDHREHQCRWPVEPDTEEPGHFYCGDHRAADSVYCSQHAELAYRPALYRLSAPAGA